VNTFRSACCIILILFLFSCAQESGKDPVIAIFGNTEITEHWFVMSFRLLPESMRMEYAGQNGMRLYMDRLAIQFAYYLEGLRRSLHSDENYLRQLNETEFVHLMDYATEKYLKSHIRITDQDIKVFYQEYLQHKDTTKLSFDQIKDIIVRKILFEKGQPLLNELLDKLYFEAEIALNETEIASPNGPNDDVVVASGKGLLLSWGDIKSLFDILPISNKEKYDLRQSEKRVKAINTVCKYELFLSDVENKRIKDDPEFKLIREVLQMAVLSRYTKARIIGDDIRADYERAKKYYENNINKYKKTSGDIAKFEEVRERVYQDATDDYRNQIAEDLGRALIRDRYPMKINEKVFKQFWERMKE